MLRRLVPWAAALALLTVAVAGGWLGDWDQQVTAWLQARRTPALDGLMRAVTFFGSSPWTLVMAAVMSGWWVLRRARQSLARFLGAGLVGMAIEVALRLCIAQWRPDTTVVPSVMDWHTRFELAGFPSGHAFRSAWLYGWWGCWLIQRRARWSVIAALGCVGLILLVGFSRVYLLRHWVTDVVGSWLVALTVLSGVRRSSRA